MTPYTGLTKSQCFEKTGGASSDLPLLPQILRVQSNELLELYILRPKIVNEEGEDPLQRREREAR